VHPASSSSQLWTRGALRPLPRTLLGVPLDLAGLAASGVLSEEGLERVRNERLVPLGDDDVSVAELVGARLGREVVDRLTDPLLGGVYAGHAARLSARAAIPQVVEMIREHGSLLAAAAAQPSPTDAPVFAGIEGGLGLLPARLAAGLDVRRSAPVRELSRTSSGFRLTVGSARTPETLETDRVVLATPSAPTARLLAEVAPGASSELAAIEYASMAIVTLAVPVPVLEVAGSSGFLVPSVEGRQIKAATYSFSKWDWVGAASELRILRASVGRHGEEASLQASDDELVSRVVADLEDATGQRLRPVDAHVQRWGGALPQYAVGHLDRIARIRADVAGVPGLVVCGAAYDGVGIPAVVGSARRAAARLLAAE
jgi:oxygen-dependent protoporphyrinogen oxidase